MKCPKCDGKMYQFPDNKLMLSCFECGTTMRNPKHLEQTSIEDGVLTKWHNNNKKIHKESD